MDIHQILDADSSQQDAIVSAKKGLSFVLQGPPGTGKSQTIANIIAECLANNKKVLFVSEKVAALDVVFKRLDNAGIGDFCLSLHSHKSNKKEIIEKIAKTLSYNIAEDSGNLTQLYAKLVYYRDQLNNYNDELHVKRLGLQKSIYEGYGELVKFIDEKDIVFEINNISEITGIDLENIILFLEEYVLTLKDNASEQLSNPWFGSTITTHTYELQYELDNNLNTLYQRLLEIIPICDKIETDISLTTKHISDSIEILRDCSNAIKIPYFWVQLDKINIIKKEIDSAEMFFYTLQASISDLNVSLVDVEKTHPQFEKQDVLGIRSTASFNSLLDYYKNFVRNDDLYAIWEKIFNFDDVQTSFYELEIKIKNYVSKKEDILTKYEEEVLDVDAKSLLKRFQLDYTSIFRYLKKQYYVDRRLLLGQTKNISKKIKKQGVEVFIADLKMLCELKELQEWFELKTDEFLRLFGECYNGANTDVEKLSEKIRNFRLIIRSAEMFTDLFQLFKKYDELDIQFSKDFSFLYNGYDTDWNYLKNAAVWAVRVCQMKKEMAPDENFIKLICEDESMPEKCAYYHAILSEKSEGLIDLLRWFYKLFDETIFKMSSPGVMLSKISACKDNIAALNNWIDYSSVKAKCISLGLESFILAVEKEGINKSKIIPVYKNHFYRKWLDCAMKESSVLKSFKRQNHENMINEFKQLDKWQFSMANRRIGELFIDKILSQSIFSQNGNEIKILQKELNKKRRIMPIRKLFQNIPNLLLTLKPCLMMSPLTVSLFLESNQFNFDIVIFDEASQVCTENAIGAISRGKQLVLAGDSKQLPPTSFFMAAISDQEYDEEDKDDYTDVDSYESILDEADSFSFPSQTLKWHYRSRHEHLIAFSNSKIYNNKLITFPSNIERTRNYGVEYIYVENGVYDKGGKRDNIEEAKKVVELIFENFRNFPNRSLGVITFSVSQRETIETVLRKERLSNLDFNDFFNEEKDESFFIKNIETVQGDERDTIIFSIGYAKDYAGKMSMFFGPLSSTGGERRLNVAITRAKYNVKLVGSILPLDIKTERITSEGPKLLRAYMDFAINGAKILKSGISVNSDDQTESPFEQSVYEFLIGQGFKVSTQIGCSGFRIDMGIHDPNDYSSFCLGIECDGPTYHSARTARERDRLRQTILEDMGWNIYRIWSTDWLKNPEYEKNRLLQAVNDTISDISRSGRTV
jgi:superfamily I DNA and/or RNA helicase/very-short-patch-repair endonuclease